MKKIIYSLFSLILCSLAVFRVSAASVLDNYNTEIDNVFVSKVLNQNTILMNEAFKDAKKNNLDEKSIVKFTSVMINKL